MNITQDNNLIKRTSKKYVQELIDNVSAGSNMSNTNEVLSKEYLEYWTCDLCGDHTHEVDYDYLGNNRNHLKCELEYENEYNAHLDKGRNEQMELEFPKEK